MDDKVDMEIEYSYSFVENVFPASFETLRFYLWIIPGFFVYSHFKARASIFKVVGALATATALLYWEYDSLNSRVAKVGYQEDALLLHQKGGEVVSLVPGEIERFWSISIGRSGGWSCYLLVKTASQDYKSFTVRKREHSCRRDAELLNGYYGLR